MIVEQRRGQLRQVEQGEEPRRVQERAGVLADPVRREIPVVHHPVRDDSSVLGVTVAEKGAVAIRATAAAPGGGRTSQRQAARERARRAGSETRRHRTERQGMQRREAHKVSRSGGVILKRRRS